MIDEESSRGRVEVDQSEEEVFSTFSAKARRGESQELRKGTFGVRYRRLKYGAARRDEATGLHEKRGKEEKMKRRRRRRSRSGSRRRRMTKTAKGTREKRRESSGRPGVGKKCRCR